MAFAFENLVVCEKAVDFATRPVPQPRNFLEYLVGQPNRAALSIATNLADGNGRFTKPERKRFFTIARGSVQECLPLLTPLV